MTEYVVDFSSWYFEAKNEQEAKQKAIERINKHECPDIINVEENE